MTRTSRVRSTTSPVGKTQAVVSRHEPLPLAMTSNYRVAFRRHRRVCYVSFTFRPYNKVLILWD